MKIINLSMLGLFIPGVLRAAEFSLLIYGASLHSQCEASHIHCNSLNGTNPGLGLEWAFSGGDEDGRWITRVGSYRDSLKETAYFLAGGYRKEWPVTEHTYAGITLLGGYLNGSGAHGLMALPMLSLGTKDFALEVGYVPKVRWGTYGGKTAVTTFNLRWTL